MPGPKGPGLGERIGPRQEGAVALLQEDRVVAAGQAPGREGVYIDANTGPCIDIFAPGVDIYSACGGVRRCGRVTPQAYAYASGTSMAAPHVAAAVALYLERHPQAAPNEVMSAVVGSASNGVLDVSVILPGTPNRVLFTGQPGTVQAANG